MTDSELKPCPFCGGPASSGEYLVEARRGLFWQTGCKVCHAAGPAADTREAADLVWNTRQ